jgi:two-component system sensor histidine kinase UhpB
VPALRWHLDRHAQRAQVKVHFSSDLGGRLPAEIETVCFRVAQEALTNTLRHARACTVWVELRRRDDEIQLSIRDDGIGFDVAEARQRALDGQSLGLLGMQERVALVGGRLDIDSRPERGTEIRVSIPIAGGRHSGRAADDSP